MRRVLLLALDLVYGTIRNSSSNLEAYTIIFSTTARSKYIRSDSAYKNHLCYVHGYFVRQKICRNIVSLAKLTIRIGKNQLYRKPTCNIIFGAIEVFALPFTVYEIIKFNLSKWSRI